MQAVAALVVAQAVDGVCRFLLRYEKSAQPKSVPSESVLDLSRSDELIAWARER